mgnify:CR=1 FL=1
MPMAELAGLVNEFGTLPCRFDGRPSTPRRSAEPTIRRTKDAPAERRAGRDRGGDLGIDVPEFLPS